MGRFPLAASALPIRLLRTAVGVAWVAFVLLVGLPASAQGHGERLHPEERARLRHELRMRPADARADHPEGGHRLSPEEKREIRMAIREERRRRHLHPHEAEPRP